MVTEGTTEPTTYSAFGTTYNISWQDEAGTVYYGTLDVINGLLTVTRGGVDFSDLSFDTTVANIYFATVTNIKNPDTNAQRRTGIQSNKYKPSDTIAINNNMTDKAMLRYDGKIFVRNTDYQTIEDFNANKSGTILVYELATPITCQLTPTEIRSLLGLNNVWADCGSVAELKYTRDLNLCINDIIARIEALEGSSNSRSLSLSPTLTKSLTSELDEAEGILEDTKETEE
jgi:hypothetical protein